MKKVFEEIKQYHEVMGWPIPHEGERTYDELRDMNNTLIAALHNEVTELQESTPWKPWRPIDYKPTDMDNMAEEVVDILFFLGAFMENNGLSWEAVENAFNEKMRINYERIETGYSQTR